MPRWKGEIRAARVSALSSSKRPSLTFGARTAAAWIASMAASIGLVGCSSSVVVRDESVASPRSAGSWSGVFGAAGREGGLAQANADDLATRHDLRLGVVEPQRLEATNQWPQEARPSLRHRRSISIPVREQSYIYFFPERERWPRPRGW